LDTAIVAVSWNGSVVAVKTPPPVDHAIDTVMTATSSEVDDPGPLPLMCTGIEVR
jgi:hypothetical protein